MIELEHLLSARTAAPCAALSRQRRWHPQAADRQPKHTAAPVRREEQGRGQLKSPAGTVFNRDAQIQARHVNTTNRTRCIVARADFMYLRAGRNTPPQRMVTTCSCVDDTVRIAGLATAQQTGHDLPQPKPQSSIRVVLPDSASSAFHATAAKREMKILQLLKE